MAEIGKGMSRFDVESLQETLCVQEQLIEKLYNELDEESEASASAATEALSMILRLQGEKAAEEMEAEQYKRFVEEKMSHAEESLSILQELIDQKQMEIDELDYHVQAYRNKLVSMGYDDDIDASDIELLENLQGKMVVQSIGRSKSTPNIHLKYASMKKGVVKDEKISSKRDLNDVSMAGSISLYCEQIEKLEERVKQIEKLEERVKQIAGANYAKLSSLPASKRSSCNNFLEQFKETYLVEHRGNKCNNGAAASRSASPPKVLDVFEVPQAIKDEDFVVPKKAEKQLVKDETDWHKKHLEPMQHLEICPVTSASETAEIHRVDRTTFEVAEVERQCTRQESNRQDELMLLHDIKEQPNLVPMQHLEICPMTSASKTAEINRVNRTTFEIAEVERQGPRKLLHDTKEQLNLVPMQHLKSCPTTSASETAEIRRANKMFEIAEVKRQGTRQEPERHEELMLLHDIKEQLNLVPVQHLKICPMTSASETAEIRHANKMFEMAEVKRHGTRQELERHEELTLLHDIKEQLNLAPMQHLKICPRTSASETAEIRRANKMFEMAEVKRHGTRQEPERHEELTLLHDIKEQLNLVPMQHENKLHRVGEAASPTTSASETAEIRHINRTTFEIAEVERQRTRNESNRHEELVLLHEIKEQLILMQSDIRCWKNIKSPPRHEPSIVSLTEVMVCFWL